MKDDSVIMQTASRYFYFCESERADRQTEGPSNYKIIEKFINWNAK